jgi:5-methylcytosine-specific restriction endonuclease McrA
MNCSICLDVTNNQDIILTNNEFIHNSCLEKLQLKNTDFDNEIDCLKKKVDDLSFELKKFDTVRIKILKLIKRKEREDEKNLKSNILEIRDRLSVLLSFRSELLSSNRIKLKLIYDYWPSRPLDWEERRKDKVIDSEYSCSNCYDDDVELHVHHKIPISSGGSHKSENLVVLCIYCHHKMHGGNEFNEKIVRNYISPYQKKLETIKTALLDSKKLYFRYRKYDGERSIRTIEPYRFTRVSSTQCIEGYCNVREEKRTFAIKRMTYLKIID